MTSDDYSLLIGIITLVISALSLVVLIVYTIITNRLVDETAKMRELQTDPSVSMYLAPDDIHYSLKNLVIINYGLGAAYDIKFAFNPDFVYHSEKKISELPLFNKGISYLGPNQKIVFRLVWRPVKNDTPSIPLFNVDVKYYNSSQKEKFESFIIDTAAEFDLLHPSENPLVKINKNLEEIVKAIERKK
ncbi:hypothetical protein KSK55_01470 [Methanospirillum purgamenti]|jgi:hypothetical protein|uniref:Uncharacterized protein n=1 Tax=Methanospirillum hungatei TaxID=2203 RepID=A0A8F5ZF49_METHU|nr:hypothetical protein [Methanospirillum hungatei]QXO95110.1 hypothetical protein KSK55_01470 [Methanospirillum hungatei]